MLRRRALVLVLASAGLVAGCGAVPSTGSTADGVRHAPGSPAPLTTPAAPTTPLPTSTGAAAGIPSVTRLSPPTRGGLAWTVVRSSPALAVAHAGDLSLLWMDPTRLRFRYVPGTQVPEGSPATAADRTPATWTAHMVAAFNSGYKLRDHVGGFLYRGRAVATLRAGLGAFTISTDGTLAVGVWGHDLTMTPTTLVVRENLPPLVASGVVRASASDGPRTWGIANGNATHVNRSALARLRDGALVFAFGHDVTALQLARGLVAIGAVDAVMLDMNRSWPTGFVYQRIGGVVVGRRIDPRIARDPSTYLQPFKKDFVVVSPR